ncbi:MAG: hypothetical protein KAT11_00395, partial [Phycisphaerae bacterium]|nr:hypothetical protein [Phycisphaerae bacterium]
MQMVSAQQLARMLDDRSSPMYRALGRLYADTSELPAKARLCLEAAEAFIREFGADHDVFVVRSTGRVNLMGMHVDHRGGFVNPMAIKEVFFVVQPREDDVVELRNAEPNLFGPTSFRISRELPKKRISDWDSWTQQELENRRRQGRTADWSNCVKAAVLYLQHLHTTAEGTFEPRLRGMNVAVKGNIPRAAGLSSSSAIVVGAMEACMKVNALEIRPLEMVEACRLAEWYVGTRGGGGDHAAIKFGQKNHILHIGSFPFSVTAEFFPDDYSIVLADSLVQARKQGNARDIFNERVASYVFGLLMLRRNFPNYAAKMEHLRDVNPRKLGLDEAGIYRMIRSLPLCCSRAEILAELPGQRDLIEQTFRTHAPPSEGYRIRQVCTYGITECIRSEMAGELIRKGDLKGFGELVNISHEGDRVSRLVEGKRLAHDNSISDAQLDGLIAACNSNDPVKVERSRLWRQPGGYNVSTKEQDALVD